MDNEKLLGILDDALEKENDIEKITVLYKSGETLEISSEAPEKEGLGTKPSVEHTNNSYEINEVKAADEDEVGVGVEDGNGDRNNIDSKEPKIKVLNGNWIHTNHLPTGRRINVIY